MKCIKEIDRSTISSFQSNTKIDQEGCLEFLQGARAATGAVGVFHDAIWPFVDPMDSMDACDSTPWEISIS